MMVDMPSRLKMLTLPVILGLFLSACGNWKTEPGIVVLPRESRPNIVFILVDDLESKLGTIEYMKNLQELMVLHGTSLDDFLITTPVCCPSRSTILRGQYTHSHKVYHNEFPDGGFYKFRQTGDEMSQLGTWLQAAGYRTALMGKYLNGYPYSDDRTYFPPGWSEWVSPARKNAYDGYDYVLNENGELVEYTPDEVNYFTDVVSRKATDFIRRAAGQQAPFFIYLAPFAPHAPATPARRHLDSFPSISIPDSPSFNEADVSDKPVDMSLNPLLTERQIENLNELYRMRIRSLQAVDEMLAEIIDVLEQTGELQDTFIVFTSDNGFHMGQHRLYAGKDTFYEEDIVVPFIVRGPGVPEGRSLPGFLAGNVDIAPTLAEWAGIVPPEYVEGRSLAAAITGDPGPPEAWRRGYLLEIYPSLGATEESRNGTPSMVAANTLASLLRIPVPETQDLRASMLGIRTDRYVYVEHQNGFVEMYDLTSDPFELENLASTADQDLLNGFSDWLEALSACGGRQCIELDMSIPGK